MAALPFVLNLDDHPFYNPDIFPNNIYRRQHPRAHHPLDMHTLGLISALVPHARQLLSSKGELNPTTSRNGIGAHHDHDFAVNLDVGLFRPEELSVKVVNDCIVIEGKHEEREADDTGYISRHFVRRYPLPRNYDPDCLVSKLSSDGVLSVTLPRPLSDGSKERIIPIQHTGPNDLFLKKTKSTNGEDESAAKQKEGQ